MPPDPGPCRIYYHRGGPALHWPRGETWGCPTLIDVDCSPAAYVTRYHLSAFQISCCQREKFLCDQFSVWSVAHWPGTTMSPQCSLHLFGWLTTDFADRGPKSVRGAVNGRKAKNLTGIMSFPVTGSWISVWNWNSSLVTLFVFPLVR